MQRNIERNIRNAKRELATLEKAGQDTTNAKAKLRQFQKEYTKFTNETGLIKQNERVAISKGSIKKTSTIGKEIKKTSSDKIDIFEELKSKNIVVDKDSFRNVKEEVLNRQLEQLNNLSKKYPISFNDKPLQVSSDNLGRGVDGQMGGSPINKTRKLMLSKNNLINKTIDDIQKSTMESIENGFHTKVDINVSDIYVVTHEYGHYVQRHMLDTYSKNNQKEFEEMKDKVSSTYDMAKIKRILSNYEDKFAKKQFLEVKEIYQELFNSSIVNDISKYGKSNFSEAWAEMFADYELNNGTTKVGQALEVFLERNFEL